MSEKRRGLGRGLGALIPSAPAARPAGDRPVDVFFPEKAEGSQTDGADGAGGANGSDGAPGVAVASAVAAPSVPPSAPAAVAATAPSVAPVPSPPTARQSVPSVGGGTLGRGIGALSEGLRAEAPASAPTPAGHGNGTSGNGTSGNGTSGNGTSGNGTSGNGTSGNGTSGNATNGSPASAAPAAPDSSTAAATPATAAPTGDVELVPVPGARFAEIPVTAISPNPRQPRTVFDEEALAELVHSVKEVGVLQPVVVRQTGEDSYELIMGERRWRAVQEAGFTTVPAIIRDTTDDNLLRDALLENLHRSQLNPLEEAAAYQQLLDDFGCTHEELAARIGRSRPQISNTLRLMKLPPLVQRRVAAGILSAGHARALLGLEDSASMEALAARIVSEGLSVRAVEEIVALGDGPVVKPAKKRPRPGAHHSELDALASRLGDKLDTRVSVALGRSKGRLSIDFASVEDLNRIITLMAPELRGVFKEN